MNRSRVIVEFVAIPPDLDIHNFMSVPESVGRFRDPRVKKEHIFLIAESIKNSPVFTLVNALESVLVSCISFLNILQEIGITVKTVSNIKRSNMNYREFLESEHFSNDVDDQDRIVPGVVVVVVNLFPLISDNLMEDALESIIKLEEFQEEIKQSIEKAEL